MSHKPKFTPPTIPLDKFRILIVCRGPIAMEALEVAAEMGLPKPQMIVSKREIYESVRAFAPWAEHTHLYEKLHIVDDYRDQDAILAFAAREGLQGIYVGYGMNAENAEFIERCEKAGLSPIAPPSEVMAFSASKFRAKKHVRDTLGIRVLPGSDKAAVVASEGGSDEEIIEAVTREAGILCKQGAGQVIRLKAVAGGGGKGQRLITRHEEAPAMVRQIWAEIGARGVNGDKGILVELNLSHPRHWEVQVFSDGDTVVHYGARECSIQNAGSQKFVEVSLHPQQFDGYIARLDPKKDAGLVALLKAEKARVEETCKSACDIMKSLGYRGAGTVEFLVAESGGEEMLGKPHFMEINSRIQVEHRVSEAVTRVRGKVTRLVGEQFRIAAGQKLGYTQDDITFEGHSTELRINTSISSFLIGASGSVIDRYRIPPTDGNFYYDDGGAHQSFAQGMRRAWAVPNFDSNFGLAVMIGKDQTDSYAHAEALLRDFIIEGNEQLRTTRPFHLGVLATLLAGAPYAKVRTDFSEIFLAFGALVHHALARIKRNIIPGGDPLARLLTTGLASFQKEPALAIAFGVNERRVRDAARIPSGEMTRWALTELQALTQLALFPEEQAAVNAAGGEYPQVIQAILDAVAASRIHEFRRNDNDLELFIPENVRQPRERQILIEELRDATVQGVQPRPLPAGETAELHAVHKALESKLSQHLPSDGSHPAAHQALTACLSLTGNGPLSPAQFKELFDELRRVKWSIRKASLPQEIESILMAEVNAAMRIIRGPNVVAHLAGTIYLKPTPAKPPFVEAGDEVREDETVLALLENMKMFNEIRAHMSGRIKSISVENERPVLPGDVIMVIE